MERYFRPHGSAINYPKQTFHNPHFVLQCWTTWKRTRNICKLVNLNYYLNLNERNQLSKNIELCDLVTHRNYCDKSLCFHFGSKHNPTSLWECHLTHYSNSLKNVWGASWQDLHILCIYKKMGIYRNLLMEGCCYEEPQQHTLVVGIR